MHAINQPRSSFIGGALLVVSLIALVGVLTPAAQARNPYRKNFFDAYPSVETTRLGERLDGSSHCGVCHFDFDGGGPRNPYGLAVEATDRSIAAILGLGPLDSDGDGVINDIEILDPNADYDNTPTFPGLLASNLNQVSNIDPNEIAAYLTPTIAGDTTPPSVTVTYPNGGQTLTSADLETITWTATDNSGLVSSIEVYVTFDNGVHHEPVTFAMSNTGSLPWFVPNRPTTTAYVRVVAYDATGNMGVDESDTAFTIVSGPTGLVPTTLRDFDMPGSQPFEAGQITSPDDCRTCHGDYDAAVEPYHTWQGSMMAQASIDPVFLASLEIANLDAPESGDICLRCHMSKGWLEGRSSPTDGSAMLAADKIGVSCDLCHRMVNPTYVPGESPIEDQTILAALSNPPVEPTLGQFVIDPTGLRRGPYDDAVAPHAFVESPFHRSSAFCGTCHDVSNPAFFYDPNSDSYVPNAFDAPSGDTSPHSAGVVERTYSEWLASAFNDPNGVIRPDFGGAVSSCQDCHMPPVTGRGCNNTGVPLRHDLPLHDMTGGSAWMIGILDQVEPALDPNMLADGAARARSILQKAASLDLVYNAGDLVVTVTNLTGHKLPTGYPEGRRIWIEVAFFDANDVLIKHSGEYDPNSAELHADGELKVYEILPAVGANIAPVVGLPAGTEFHFVLNNDVLKDNRIPPEGFTNTAFAAFGGAPVGATYADGQYWDMTTYAAPFNAVRADVSLKYQSISREFAEFLRDNGLPGGAGEAFYNFYVANGMCPPEEMESASIVIPAPLAGDVDLDGCVDSTDLALLLSEFGCIGGCGPADLDADGDVDSTDLSILLGNFGAGACS